MTLAQTIYANLLQGYADLSKAKEMDLAQLAREAIRAADIFEREAKQDHEQT